MAELLCNLSNKLAGLLNPNGQSNSIKGIL